MPDSSLFVFSGLGHQANLAQFETCPEFMGGVVSVRQIGDRRTHWVTEVAGARREFDAEIVEQRPDERIAWQSTTGSESSASESV